MTAFPSFQDVWTTTSHLAYPAYPVFRDKIYTSKQVENIHLCKATI